MFNIKDKLKMIKDKNLLRDIFYFKSPQDRIINLNDKNMLLFSSNNYLSLCNDEKLIKESMKYIKEMGIGSGGSRLTTGSNIFHKECEDTISEFKEKEDSILYTSGYLCNVGSIPSLFDHEFTIFSDELNHASIISGIKLSKGKKVIYKHLDIDDLNNKMKESSGKKVIITDGVFSMDGDICDLPNLLELAYTHDAYIYIDDAHGTGVLGEYGRGTMSHFNIKDSRIILMGTGSKALGASGGFISSSKEVISYLKNTSRSFIFSTSESPERAKTLSLSIKKVMKLNKERANLKSMSIYLRESLKGLGYNVIDGITPIVPVILGDPSLSVKFREEFLKENIFITPIRPPSVPTSRIRITLMSSHTKEDLDMLISIFKKCYKKYENKLKESHNER